MSTKERNKELIERFPFLAMKVYDPEKDRMIVDPNEDYSATWLDCMPKGWAKAFGLELCEELRAELVRAHFLDDYYVIQVKEKYGGLRWYDGGVPRGNKKIWEIIAKYEELSMRTCCRCGAPATKLSRGWVCPYCGDCAAETGWAFDDIESEQEEPDGKTG